MPSKRFIKPHKQNSSEYKAYLEVQHFIRAYKFVVRVPFWNYQRGKIIKKFNRMIEILHSPLFNNVVKVPR